ncbi:hypothetical protein JXA85_04625 [Candidatus Woesearchaeota archaeon]|nr:hypothetical protein [Candidatus Woesearchaeota archaeon]
MFWIDEKMKRGIERSFLFLLVVFVIVGMNPQDVDAAAGIACNVSDSPCQCGTQCNSGCELANDYNTIDWCEDGTGWAGQYFEYVQDLTVTNLNDSDYDVGDMVNINGYFKCSDDGDYVSFAYNNGSGWRNVYNAYCNTPGFVNHYKNMTLDNVAGNHTIRAIIVFDSGQGYTNVTCGYDEDGDYSDTDDVIILVEGISAGDTSPPTVEDIIPSPGTTFDYSPSQSITISARVTDETGVDDVYINVSWDDQKTMIIINDENMDDVYETEFTNTNFIGRYNVTFYAIDANYYVNVSETTFFYINSTEANITVRLPSQNNYYSSSNLTLDFEISGFIPNTTYYSVNSESNATTTARVNLSMTSSDQDGTLYESSNVSVNTSQSFLTVEPMNTRYVSIMLKKSENISLNSRVELRSDDSGIPSSTIIANGTIDDEQVSNASFSFVSISLNGTANLTNNTRYWLTLLTNATGNAKVLWEANNDGFYENGNCTTNGTRDLLFSVFDAYHYRTVVNFSQGINTLAVYSNNSNGVIASSALINFTVDSSPPELQNISKGDVVEYGNVQTIRAIINDSISQMSKAMIEINYNGTLLNYTMNNMGNYTYNYSFTPLIVGNISFRLFANDSVSNLLSSTSYSFIVNDTTPPCYSDTIYSPNTTAALDPNVTIYVNITFLDNYLMNQAILQYKNTSHGDWLNMTMGNKSSSYYANFTPCCEDNWTFRIMGTDAFNLTNTTLNTTLSVYYDRTWNYSSTINSTGASIGTNVSLGNITINNTADISLEFSFAKSSETVPEVYFNQSSFNVSAGSSKKVEITATAPLTQSEYSIGIVINSTTADSVPSSETISTVLATYTNGPFLIAEIQEYDPTVTLEQQRIAIKSVIKNVGNETAQGVNATWTLPDGWTAKSNLTLELGNISVGQSKSHNILADAGGSVGTKTITIYAIGNSGLNDSDSKTVEVSEEPGSGGNNGGSSTSGSGGGSSTVVKEIVKGPLKPSVVIIADAAIEIMRGENKEMEITFWNNGETNITSTSISIRNPGMIRSTVDSEMSYLKESQKKKMKLSIAVPEYINDGKYIISVVLSGISEKEGVTFSKEIIVIVMSSDKSNITSCILDAEYEIKKLEERGFSVAIIKEKLAEVNRLFVEKEYEQSADGCRKIKELAGMAYSVSQLIDGMRKEVSGNKNAEEILAMVEDALARGDFALAKERFDKVSIIAGIEKRVEEENPINLALGFVRKHLLEVLLLLISVSIAAVLIYRTESARGIDKRIEEYHKEEKHVTDLMKDVQSRYLVKKDINKHIYEKNMNDYRKRISVIYQKISDLRLKKVKLGKLKLSKDDLEKEKSSIIELEKELQRKYFVEKVISKESYEKMISGFRRNIMEIEKKVKEMGNENKQK